MISICSKSVNGMCIDTLDAKNYSGIDTFSAKSYCQAQSQLKLIWNEMVINLDSPPPPTHPQESI